MKIGFVTCVELGLSCMRAIYGVGGKLDFALTLCDELASAKSGRAYIDEFCGQHAIRLAKVANINNREAINAIAAADLDWLFVVGWSQIARTPVLQSTRLGVLGMHPTLLPVGRGRAAIPWAILLGLRETGVTLFKMDTGVDTGPVIAQTKIPIDAGETATTLYSKVATAHATLLQDNWRALIDSRLAPARQDDGAATVWAGRKPEDGRITGEFSVFDAEKMIRAVTRPYPGAFIDEGGDRLRIWACGSPGQSCGGDALGSKVRRLHFRDGWLDAVEWDLESLPWRG
jgi:methionyl-tRNA formyltransferase